MKRLPLTQEDRLFLKSIKGTAVVILLMFKVYPTPVNADNLAFEMSVDRRTAGKYLDDLSANGFTALMKGQGYVLTSQARELMMHFFGNLVSIEAQDLAQQPQVQAQQVLEATNPITHTVCALEEEDSLTKELKKDSSSSEKAHNLRELPTTAQIIAATPILFGEPGVAHGHLDFDEIDPMYALSVLAHCYALRKDRENPNGLLHRPAGLAYKMLLEGKRAQAMYVADPLRFLSSRFLEILHLAAPEQEAIGEESPEEPVLEAAPLKPISVEIPASAAWQLVLDQLHMEMNHVNFENWVKDTQVVGFDGHIVTVGACNKITCEWLESRLTRVVERALIGIMNQQVSVRFVVAAIERREDSDDQ